MLGSLRAGDIRALGEVTMRNFRGPIQTIIPWASTYYTERLIEEARREFGEEFWGFWMLGGMSGRRHGIHLRARGQSRGARAAAGNHEPGKAELSTSLPFAMEPVVYDFSINERGTFADLLEGPPR